MAANILLRSYGFTLNKGVRLAYVGQFLLGAIWLTQHWPRISNKERTSLIISCLEMLPLKIFSLARTCAWPEPLLGLVPGQHPDRIIWLPNFSTHQWEAMVQTQTSPQWLRKGSGKSMELKKNTSATSSHWGLEQQKHPWTTRVFVRSLAVDSTCTHPDRKTPQAIWWSW